MKMRDPGDALHWWGRKGRKVAHWFIDIYTDDSACGRVVPIEGGDTRLDPETGEPWPKCKGCLAATQATLKRSNGEP